MNRERILRLMGKHNAGLAETMRDYPNGLDWQWSQRRAVYVVQVFTASVAWSLDVSFRNLRVRPQRRTAVDVEARGVVAGWLRGCRPTADEVRDCAEKVLADPRGRAERIDIGAELAAVA